MRTILNKYIVQHVMSSIGLITLMLLGLQLFMLLVGEVNSIGNGAYDLLSAFVYVLLKLPYQLYLFFPIACLLGVLMGLGVLSNNNELLIIRAHGVSPSAIALIIFKSVGVLVFIVCVLGEFAFPKLIRFSEDWKSNLRSNGQSLRTENGLWLRQHQSFIHINHVVSNKKLEGIHQYKFNEVHELILARYIKKAFYEANQWRLEGIDDTNFSETISTLSKRSEMVLPYNESAKPLITSSYKENQIWQLNLSPNMLVVSDSDPNEMSLITLVKLILAKRKEHLDAGNFEMNFWRRIFQPLATFIMVLLAMPFVFGSIRSVSVGQRFLLGSAVGFLFHLLNEFVVPVSQIYQIPPFFAASMPMLFFSLLGFILIFRVR